MRYSRSQSVAGKVVRFLCRREGMPAVTVWSVTSSVDLLTSARRGPNAACVGSMWKVQMPLTTSRHPSTELRRWSMLQGSIWCLISQLDCHPRVGMPGSVVLVLLTVSSLSVQFLRPCFPLKHTQDRYGPQNKSLHDFRYINP